MKFFADSHWIEFYVTRPLQHIAGAYEIDWDEELRQYVPVDVPLETTLVSQLNDVLETVEALEPKQGYHDFEDKILSSMTARYPLFKIGKLWLGEDYATMLEYGGWQQQHGILLAAAGRVRAAKKRGQHHFDEMHEAHRDVLGELLAIAVFYLS